MAFNRFDEDMNIISKLPDEPNDVGGLSGEALKAEFDKAGLKLKQYVNDVLLPALEALTGAQNIGVQVAGLTGAQNIQAAFEKTVEMMQNITQGSVMDGSITTAKLANGAVTTAKLANGAVTTDKLANEGITAAKLSAGSVTNDKLANGAVTTDKLADEGITAEKLGAGCVTNEKLADGAVGTDNIDSYAVTTDKLGVSSVTAAKIAPGAVGTDNIADKAVTPAKLDRAYAELDANDKVTPDQASSLVVTKTESYTLQASDAGKFIMFLGSGAKTLTVPDDPSDELFPIGTEIEVCHYAYDVTSVTIAESGNVHIYSPGQKKTLVSQSACVVLKKVRPNEWILAGALR